MLMCVAVKKAILNLRLRPEVRDEFAVAAELRGASMSGLLHQFIVRTIREEKELSPQAFTNRQRKVYAPIEPKGMKVSARDANPVTLINPKERSNAAKKKKLA